jgi:hypothetical protein
MSLIDRCHLKYPFYGSRRIRVVGKTRDNRVVGLTDEGHNAHQINPLH